ncbi:MAG: Uma2 family endonuclease [Acidimicrobiales bacterium]
MRAVVVDLPEWELEERRRKGLDVFDEVWDGVLHMAPQPSSEHQGVGARLVATLLPLAEARGLRAFYETSLFRPGAGGNDYRVPDLVFVRPENVVEPGVEGSVELAVEILSPNDETYDKLDFYALVGVQELLIIEPRTRRVELFVLRGGRLHAALPHPDGSVTAASLGVSLSTVEGPALRLEWPDGASTL